MAVLTRRNAAASKANAKLLRRVLIWRMAKDNPGYRAPDIAQALKYPVQTVRRAMKLRLATPKELLEALEIDAVRAWRDAIPVAGRKGDHRPAKDLLLHTRAIQPIADTAHTGITVLIGSVLMPGLSPAQGDVIDVIPNELNDSMRGVTDMRQEAPTPADLGADGRAGDPAPGSG